MDLEQLKWLEDVRKRLAARDGNLVDDAANAFWKAGFDVDPAAVRADAQRLLDFADMLLAQLVMQEQRRSEASAAIAESLTPYGADYTWTCNACGDRRDDNFISVAHRKMIGPGGRGSWQINARYCNDRPDCLRQIPAWLDAAAAPSVKANGCYRIANIDKPPLRVHHKYLARSSDESDYRVLCPLCGGALLVYRNQKTAVLSRRDRCIRCGQLYIYLDETIGGEPVEPLP
jgi:predicted RNA-binding Zn-ribbon protein involved in translation (DUF1610 family)